MIKRILAITLVCLLPLFPLTGCRQTSDDDTLTVVCTIYPIYDWVSSLCHGVENIEVILLVQNGSDLHSYQPTAADMAKIASCDILIRNGGTSDTWVREMASRTANDKRQEIVLFEVPDVTLREISDSSLAQGHEHDHDHDHDDTCEVDEHIWLSLSNAMACVNYIGEQLCQNAKEDDMLLRQNTADYIAKLQALQDRYTETVSAAQDPKLLFADRFPFIYLTEEYGIEYLAAFAGCTTESNATAETIVRLAKKLDEWNLSCVCVTESTDRQLAESVIRASTAKNQTILSFHSMQSVPSAALENGITYLSVMEDNLTVLRQALLS